MPMTKGLGTTRNPPNINLGRHHLSFVGATPFYVAARNGDVAFMKLLVDHGADPNINTEVRHHAVDGGRRSRLLGRRDARARSPAFPKQSVCEAVKLAAVARQRHQRARPTSATIR